MSAPIVTDLEWGTIVVLNPDGSRQYKDAKIWPNGSRSWDWRETGTRHVPGIQTADIKELIEKGAKKIVLSTGMNEALQIQADTVAYAKRMGVEVFIMKTKEAVEHYNTLSKAGEMVGGLFHSTC